MAVLTPDHIRQENGVTVKEKTIPDSARATKYVADYCRVGQPMKPCRGVVGGKVRGVTIHNTADIDAAPGTTAAEQYARATWPNCNMGGVVVHYYVDAAEAWQLLREEEQGWHAADGAGPGNTTTVAIEVIMSGDGGIEDQRAEENAARLAASILYRQGLDIGSLYTHNHWMDLSDELVYGKKKNCPIYILPHWDRFKARVKEWIAPLERDEASLPDKTELWHVQCGAFQNIENAKALESELWAKGLPTYLVLVDDLVKVQVGAFSLRSNAAAMAKKVQALGYKSYVTMASGAPVTASGQITTGSRVRVERGARSYTGGELADWVYGTVFDVLELKGSRAVIGLGGKVTAALNLYNIYLV